ncbi:MAG: hypothetical protein ACXWQE_09195, partial [Bdellovibrionales bacterium]
MALIGLGLLTVAAGALYWIVSRKPLIRADSENLEVHTIIGTVLKTRWSNISKIYVVTEQEHPTRSWIKVRKIYFRRTSEKDQAITPLIDIPEYRLGITFDEMRKEILSFPAADLVADDSFRNAPTEPILSRIEKVYTAGRYAVIALICGYSLYIFVSIQPRVQSALDLRPTRVEIRCNRNDTDLSCNLIEYLANDGQVKQQISITGVKRFSTSGDTYTSVFLEASSPKKTRIATV